MAKELQCDAPTGVVLYAQIRRQTDGQVWNTSGTPAFQAYATANIADYDIAMTEAGTASGYYTGDFPSTIAAGLYDAIYLIRAGGAPAETDTKVAIEEIQWSGSAPLSLNVIPVVTTVTNQLTAAQIATGVWQDATAGDFTVASSIGKALYINNVAPGAAGGHFISGSNAGTTTVGALTVTGATTLAALSMTTLTASGAVAFQSTFAVTTSTSLAALSCTTLTASGAVAFQSTFATTGTTTFNAFTVTNAFTVSGATTFTGAITGSNASNNLRINGVAPGSAGGLFIAGTNAATTVTTSFTTTFTGNLTGSVGSVTGLTASNLDATISSRMATYTQPTGFLAATFPLTVASTTNITGGTITTVTNLTNAPTSGDFTATMKTSIGTAVAASAVASVTGNVGGNVTGSVGSVVGAVGSVTGAVGSVTGNVGGNVTGSVGSVATGGITAASIADGAIDAATFAAGVFPTNFAAMVISVGGLVDTNLVTIDGTGVDTGLAQIGVNIVTIDGNPLDPAVAQIGVNVVTVATGAITAAAIADAAIDTATFATGATIPRCTLVDTLTTYTGNTPQTGDAYAVVTNATYGNPAIKAYLVTNLLTPAGVRTAIGLASANLDTQLADLPTVAEFEARTIVSADYATAASIAALNNLSAAQVTAAVPSAAQNAAATAAQITTDHGSGSYLTATSVTVSDKTGFSLTAAYDAAKTAAQASDIPTAAQNAAGLLDLAAGIETGLTVREGLRLIVAAEGAKTSGAATTTFVIRNVGDTLDRITATVDADGNRTAVTRNLS